jgi:L-alanine-DL-glutamate epimerase-like enolase superfamily enzyme
MSAMEYELQSIETYLNEDICICKVTFEGNNVGYGQLGNKDVDITCELLHRRVAPALFSNGKPIHLLENFIQLKRQVADSTPDRVMSPIMERVLKFELNYKMMGVQLAKAVAGVDSAIWDAIGKFFNKPVWQIWKREFFSNASAPPTMEFPCNIKVYASSIAREFQATELAEKFLDLQNKFGIDGFKMKVGERMQGRKYTKEDLDQMISDIRIVQNRLDKSSKISIDANGGFQNAADVLRICGERNVWFFEEPFPWYTSTLKRAIPASNICRLAGGEQEFRSDVWEFAIHNKCFDIVQPDFGYCGGPSQVLLICLLAKRKGVKCMPHSPQNDFHPVMSVHILKAQSDEQSSLELACVDDGLIQVKLNALDGSFQPKSSNEPVLFIKDGKVDFTATARTTQGWCIDISKDWLSKAKNQVSTSSQPRVNTKRSFL